MKTQVFMVTVPALVPQREMVKYIREAVEAWSGQYEPSNPLFGTLRGKVRVRSASRVIASLNVIATK